MFGVVDETTTTKFASRACAVHCISLPVVVDKVVVVVLKFPDDEILGSHLRSDLHFTSGRLPPVRRPLVRRRGCLSSLVS